MATDPNYYFDLSGFEHAKIFDGCAHVWEAIPKIEQHLNALKLGIIKVNIPTGAHLIHAELISIGEGTVVEPGAFIQGPCFIGKNCTIRHGAYIRGHLIAGDHCLIGHDTEVKNALFLNNAHAAHFAYVGDSILGNHINLGAGTVCANLKLDHGTIFVQMNGQTINTGLRKFGAIIGDNSQIGCNCVLNPGTLLGKGVNSYPCTNFGGFTAADHLIKSEARITKRLLPKGTHASKK